MGDGPRRRGVREDISRHNGDINRMESEQTRRRFLLGRLEARRRGAAEVDLPTIQAEIEALEDEIRNADDLILAKQGIVRDLEALERRLGPDE
jgi:hypothetical protein